MPKFQKGDRVVTTEDIEIPALYHSFIIPKGTLGTVIKDAELVFDNIYEYTVDLDGQEEIYLTERYLDHVSSMYNS